MTDSALGMDEAAFHAAWARLLRLLGTGWADEPVHLKGLSRSEWTDLLTLADRHWVTPILHRRLASDAALSPCVPKDVRTEFRRRYLRSGFRHARFAAVLAPVLSAFRTAGIDVVLLKGSHLAPLVYEKPAERPMMDVDLLIRERDIDAAVRILGACGFRQSGAMFAAGPAPGPAENTHRSPRGGATRPRRDGPVRPVRDDAPVHNEANAERHELAPFRHPARVQIDLHYALVPPSRMGGIDHEALMRRATPVRIAGGEALALAPEDLLLHLCIHAAFHDRLSVKLLSLLDVPVVVDRYRGRIDWTAFRDRARAWRAERSVLITFALVERLFGWRTPDGALCGLGALPGDFDAVALAERLVRQRSRWRRVADIAWADNVARVLAGKGLFAGATILLRRLFPSPGEMAALHGTPANSRRSLCHYPRRLAYLAVRYAPAILRIARRDAATMELLRLGADRNRLTDWLGGG